MLFYYLVVSGGVEIEKEGPYISYKDRDKAARKEWNSPEFNQHQDSVFWLDTDAASAEVKVGAYTQSDLDTED